MSWKKLSTKQVYKNHWMEITEDQIKTPSGKKLTFGVVHKKPFALIIPWDGKYFTLVTQYRYPINSFTWEFPQGHYEHASIKITAQKELAEETGLRAKKMQKIGSFYLASAHHTQECHVFFATELTAKEAQREESEKDTNMQAKKVTLEDFETMVNKGLMKDGPSLAAFTILKLKKLLM